MWIAQLSDPHIRPPGLRYKDVADTAAALAAAVRQVNALLPLPDLVVLTGDVAEEGLPAEYALARRILAELRPPLLAIPGNHDQRAPFRAAFQHLAPLPEAGPLHLDSGDRGPMRILGLDVTLPGKHHGEVDEAALAWLEAALATEPSRPTLLLMHQPPLECGVPYLDRYRCFGAARLEALLARHRRVEAVLCGHVHRMMVTRFGGTLLCAAPSTGTAIALRPFADAPPASFLEPPGFLLHQWRPAGGLLTHLVPVGDFPGPYPFA